MKPIWYFIGLILLVFGMIIMLNGIYQLFVPQETPTILAELHPGIWWGAIMTVSGAVFYIKNRNVTVD